MLILIVSFEIFWLEQLLIFAWAFIQVDNVFDNKFDNTDE